MRRVKSGGLLDWVDGMPEGRRSGWQISRQRNADGGETGKGRRTAGEDMILLWSRGAESRRVLERGEHG